MMRSLDNLARDAVAYAQRLADTFWSEYDCRERKVIWVDGVGFTCSECGSGPVEYDGPISNFTETLWFCHRCGAIIITPR